VQQGERVVGLSCQNEGGAVPNYLGTGRNLIQHQGLEIPSSFAMTKWEESAAPRMLIIDDNPSIHRDFEWVLLDNMANAELEAEERRLYGQESRPGIRKPAYVLDHAFSGLEGVEKLKQALGEGRPYQLAFVDIRMPGIDGVETIGRLWQLDPRLQIVICTAYADYSWEDLVRRLGQTDKLLVLKKPFDSIEVVLMASTLCEKWLLARQAALKLEQMELLVAQRTRRLLELQRAESQLSQAPTPPPLEAAELEKELPLILLAENDPDLSREIARSLETGYRVSIAQDGAEALRQAQEIVPDLIVTGSRLPTVDGMTLCRRLKCDELASHIPVVLLTPADLQDGPLQALEAGADDYLSQPLNAALLRARVENLLGARRKVQDQFSPEIPFLPREIAASQTDAQFVRRTMETIEKSLSDYEFDVEALARKMAVSRRQLFRKLKAVTGCTPNGLIRALRLKRAAQLLETSEMTVTEITYAVGFSDLKHFRAVFREHFGVLPGEYPKKGAAGGEFQAQLSDRT